MIVAKFNIGTAHGQINYRKKEKAFKGALPAHIAQKKAAVNRSKAKDILEVARPEWNQSVHIKDAVKCIRKSRQISAYDPSLGGQKYNYRAEKLPPKNDHYVPNTSKFEMSQVLVSSGSTAVQMRTRVNTEMSINPKLEGAGNWNLSSQFLDKEFLRKVANTERARIRNSQKKNSSLKGYENPETKYRKQLKARRERTERTQEEEIAAELERQREERKMRRKHRKQKLDMSTPVISRKFKTYTHSGVWEMNKVENRMMWSDTGSEVKDSRGDIVQVVNPDAYNFC